MVRNKVRKEMSWPIKNEHQVGKGQCQLVCDLPKVGASIIYVHLLNMRANGYNIRT